MVHRVSTANGCGCEAGAKEQPCWHAMLVEIIEQAQMRALPVAAQTVSYRTALAELDECFA
jgi:hypothetical protein